MRATAFTAALLAFAALASARSARADDAARATQLFNEGRELQKNGALVEACARFRESFELDAHVGTLLNIANCEELAGHLLLAHQRWTQATALAKTTGDTRAAYAAERDAAVVQRTPKLTVRLAPGDAGDAVITLDDAPLSTSELGVAMPIDPGEHVLVATPSHGVMSKTRVTIADREEREVTIELAESVGGAKEPAERSTRAPDLGPLPPANDATSPPARAAWMRPTGYAIGAVGVVGAGIGTAFAIDAIQKKSASDAGGQCAGSTCTNANGLRLRGDASSSANLATAAFVAGGVALAGGITLLVLAPRRPAVGASPPSVRVGIGPMSVALDGAF